MQNLTPDGEKLISDVSARYNLSRDAVLHMLIAVNNGGGSMAQFNCPELGGGGQWMRGGMTMVGDMFNHGLKMTVDNLCNELSAGLANMQVFPPAPSGSFSGGYQGSNNWWPQELGAPFSSGSQNNIRYAIFPGRLAVELNGQVTVYDTLNHNIGGVSQQQGGDTSLTFSSQFGTLSVSQLPIVSGPGMQQSPAHTNFATSSSQSFGQQNSSAGSSQQSNNGFESAGQNAGGGNNEDVFQLLEKLAKLRDAGAISNDDYDAKKSELLSRI